MSPAGTRPAVIVHRINFGLTQFDLDNLRTIQAATGRNETDAIRSALADYAPRIVAQAEVLREVLAQTAREKSAERKRRKAERG